MALATTIHAKTVFFAILAGFRRDVPACVQLHGARSCARRGTGRRSRGGGGGRGGDRGRRRRCSRSRGRRARRRRLLLLHLASVPGVVQLDAKLGKGVEVLGEIPSQEEVLQLLAEPVLEERRPGISVPANTGNERN